MMKNLLLLLAWFGMNPAFLGAAEEISIGSCPRIGFGWQFKIDPYLKVAAALQDEGSEKAIPRLRSWAEAGKHEDQVVILCRMLFEARPGRDFRRPGIGGATFLGGTDYPDWPLEPIAIFERIPILITPGYLLAGVPEPSRGYLDFCVGNCNWRQDRYAVRPAAELKAIVAKWLAERKWPKPLSADDQAFFTDQADETRPTRANAAAVSDLIMECDVVDEGPLGGGSGIQKSYQVTRGAVLRSASGLKLPETVWIHYDSQDYPASVRSGREADFHKGDRLVAFVDRRDEKNGWEFRVLRLETSDKSEEIRKELQPGVRRQDR